MIHKGEMWNQISPKFLGIFLIINSKRFLRNVKNEGPKTCLVCTISIAIILLRNSLMQDDTDSLLGEEIEPFDHLELFTSFNQTLMGVHSSKHEVGDLLFLC